MKDDSKGAFFLGSVIAALLLVFAWSAGALDVRGLPLPLTFDGTSVKPSTAVAFPLGGATTPSITVTGNEDTGIYFPTNASLEVTLDGSRLVRVIAGSVRFGNTMSIGWTSGTSNLGLDTVLARASAGIVSLNGTTFSSLGTPANGSFTYCSDCTKATPCAGSGNGAWAVRLNGAWDCNP